MAFIVVDLDGCLMDDVHEQFGRFLRKDDSKIEHAFKELIFNVLDRMPNIVDSVANSVNVEKSINMHVVKALKAVYESGIDIVVRTANHRLGDDKIARLKKILRSYGIDADVEVTTDKLKHSDMDGEKPVLILDDKPNVIMNAAREGIKGILISSDYNRIAGIFAKNINKLITVTGQEGMEKACMDSLNIRSRATRSIA